MTEEEKRAATLDFLADTIIKKRKHTDGHETRAAVEVLNRATELLGKAGFIAIALDAVPVELDLYSDGENADIFMTLADGLTITLGTKKEEARMNG